MFQIDTFVEAKLATVTTRIERHGDDDKPAVSLGLELTVANTLLDCIDPAIRQTLYKAPDDQQVLPDIEQSTPVLRCNSFERHTLPAKYEGWTLQVDDGIDETTPLTFGSCKVDKLSVEAKQGGSVVLRMRVGTSDLDAQRSGMLGMHVGQPIWVTLKAPEKKPEAIDASGDAKDLPPDAGTLFAAAHDDAGPENEDDDPVDDEGGVDVTGSDAPWPFPKNGDTEAAPQSVTIERSQPGTRTARGRDRTKAAIAARKH